MNTHTGRRSPTRSALWMVVGVMAVGGLAGCSIFGPPDPGSYAEALQVCRFKANGNVVGKRSPLPVANPRIKNCLARAGWNTDGTRVPVTTTAPTR